MRYNLSDKLIAYLALLSGLSISAVAIYYSVAGLVAIFSAAVIPIIVMGVALEISKLAATVWLKQNWSRAPNFIRGYLLAAIAILMIITSMGIFGFLSKAHSDQSLVSGDVLAKISVYDEKIKTAKDNIDANRKALKQMDDAVDQVMGRSSDEKGADKAVAIRRAQQKERVRLQSEIAAEQKTITSLSEERAPIAAEVRKVEAEVGPIKYIATFVYGDTNETILEKAVTWVIIIIVIVFDPLAVILLLASQYSFQWFRKQEEDSPEIVATESVPEESSTGFIAQEVAEVMPEAVEPIIPYTVVDDHHEPDYPEVTWPFPSATYQNKEDNIFDAIKKDEPEEEKSKLDEWNSMIAEAEKAVAEEREIEDTDIIDSAPETEKQAMTAWKQDNPDSSLKLQRRLLDKGLIDQLPWQSYLKPQADFVDEAALEASKWAAENPDTEESEKAKEWAKERGVDDVSWMEHDEQGNQIKRIKENYQQNAEQNERTMWQRIQDAKK